MSLERRLEQSLREGFAFSVGEFVSYALLAAGMWLFFYVIFRTLLRRRRISDQNPTARQVRREFLQSLRSVAIYGVVTAGVVYCETLHLTRLYLRVEDYGWVWFVLSIGLMIVVHDAYFYWTHCLMHHRWLYRWLHHTHHLSTSPTPWGAYAFSPGEALVQAGIGPLLVFTLPIHPAAFGLFMLWKAGFSVLGHCGYEVFPRWLMRSGLGVFLNSVTHHAQHHEKFRANFGLYFNVWDRLLGTNHAQYEQRFESIVGSPSPPTPATEIPIATGRESAATLPVSQTAPTP